MIDYYEPQINLTLLGCGFLGPYHVGAIYLLQQIWPQKPYNKICGASCGGLLAALLISGIRIDRVLYIAFDILKKIRLSFKLNFFLVSPSKFRTIGQLIQESLDEHLPKEAHLMCNKRLGLSLTKLSWPLENKFVCSFESKKELTDAIVAGCFIPIWSGSPLRFPKFRGHYFMDGAYSDNLPKFQLTNEDLILGTKQIQICPFSCVPPASNDDVDLVSPKDLDDRFRFGSMRVMGTYYYLNWSNIIRSIYAMSLVYCSDYKHYLLAGYDDMKDYLLESNLLKCLNCYKLFGLQDTSREPACLFCLRLLEKVDSLKFNEKYLRIMEL